MGRMADARIAEVTRLIGGLRETGHPADVIGPLQDLIEAGLKRASDKR
jgi:hypothetical protein